MSKHASVNPKMWASSYLKLSLGILFYKYIIAPYKLFFMLFDNPIYQPILAHSPTLELLPFYTISPLLLKIIYYYW
jgi:hypothetical protein